MKILILLLGLVLACHSPSFAEVANLGEGIVLVDGTIMPGRILFEHPNAPLLVIRPADNASIQSLPVSMIQNAVVGLKLKTFSAPRALTDQEKKELATNSNWAHDVGPRQIGRHAKESWDKKPALIWAHPGKSGDAMSKESWLDEAGKPLAADPWTPLAIKAKGSGDQATGGTFDGDILLPAAETQYVALQPGNRDNLSAFRMRHLTVERNASYQVRYLITGNAWIKDGSDLGKGTQTGGFGSGDANKHTVFRIAGSRWPDKKSAPKGESAKRDISHWIYIDSGENGTFEVIGETGGAGDRLTVNKGTLIVSENSQIANGPRASFYSKPGTTTILLDGARIGCQDRILSDKRSTYGVSGTLRFGTKEHPITRDLNVYCALFEREEVDPAAKPTQRTAGASFVLGDTGRIEVFSVDPTKARVIFRPFPESTPYSSYSWPRDKPVPTGIAAIFAGETDFNGVVLDGFYKGGILIRKGARQNWKNVTYGEANEVKGDDLFKDL